MTPTVRSAAGSDIGRRRAVNQDSAYTSSRLLAVADHEGDPAIPAATVVLGNAPPAGLEPAT